MTVRYLFDPDLARRRVPVGHGVVLLLVGPDPHNPLHWLVQHVCRESRTDSGELLTEVMAPQMGPRHKVTLDEGISVYPSLQCFACSLHGWVEKGVWYPAVYKKNAKRKKFTLVIPKWARRRQ